MNRDDKIKAVARILAMQHDGHGADPDSLEPGDAKGIDGRCANGDPGHYRWRDFAEVAARIVDAIAP